MSELVRLDETPWEIPASARPGMRVPARVFADRSLLDAIASTRRRPRRSGSPGAGSSC
jgi:hypothetical protein